MTRRSAAWILSCALLLPALPLAAQSQQGVYQNASYTAPNQIPEGTRFLMLLDDKLDTKKLEQGKHFKAKLGEDLMAPDGVFIPRNKKIKGHVSGVERGYHARILLSLDSIETNHGWVPLVATVVGIPGEKGAQIDKEGDIERKGVSKRRAIESAAIGAAVGAAGGAAAGGGRGAGIGAAIGAGVGTGAGILTDRDLKLDKGTQLEVQLDRSLTVPAR